MTNDENYKGVLMIEKWKQAVVHLECAADSEHFYDRAKRIEQQRALLNEGRITNEQFSDELVARSRDLRHHGTALFLSHEGRRYLLTARHVVWDERSAKRELEEEKQRALSLPNHVRQDRLQFAMGRAQNRIFSIIFRVQSLDEVIAKSEHQEFLMNLGAGAPTAAAYTFSDPALDLALISLDQRNSNFADELQSIGYTPVSADSIDDGPAYEGQEIFTTGFPSSTALVGQVSQHPASAHWSSSYYSLPVSSFGKVSMLHEALPFFWADMSIYPGNSGGPIVANDRLVGVVSAQATLSIDGAPTVRTRIPFGRIIKTTYVRGLLQAQSQKDHWWHA
jgi:hypothetical protein